MRLHGLEREQVVPSSLAETFEFFQDAHNLEAITPPLLRFEVVTPRPIPMHEGTLIEYKPKLHGLPVRWRTQIDFWDPPHRFVDRQLSGPYALWHHTHSFFEHAGGTLMRDRVRYRMPLGVLGALALPLVRHDVEAIFAFRAEEIARRLG